MQISPNEIARIAQIAFVLEPIANKPGLTTRYTDKNNNLKLENFLVAGINTGDSFRELAKRVYESKDLPITYDIALQAQKDLQNYIIALLGYNSGFNTGTALVDGIFYEYEDIYTNKKIPENQRGLLNGLASEILHEKMVDMQWQR